MLLAAYKIRLRYLFPVWNDLARQKVVDELVRVLPAITHAPTTFSLHDVCEISAIGGPPVFRKLLGDLLRGLPFHSVAKVAVDFPLAFVRLTGHFLAGFPVKTLGLPVRRRQRNKFSDPMGHRTSESIGTGRFVEHGFQPGVKGLLESAFDIVTGPRNVVAAPFPLTLARPSVLESGRPKLGVPTPLAIQVLCTRLEHPFSILGWN